MPVCQHIETRSDSKIRCSSVVKNCQVKSGRPALLSAVPMHRRGGRQLAVAVMRAVSCRSLSCAPCCRQTMRRTRNIDSERDYTGARAEPPGNGERRAAGAYRLPVPWGARRHGGRRGQQLGHARVIPGGMSAAVRRVPLQRSISVLWPVSRLCGASVQTDPPPGTVQVENQFALYQFIEISTKLQTIRMHGWWRQALSCASLSQSLPRRPDASQRTHACIHASIRERSTLTM